MFRLKALLRARLLIRTWKLHVGENRGAWPRFLLNTTKSADFI